MSVGVEGGNGMQQGSEAIVFKLRVGGDSGSGMSE
jgi:hypothetical protein